MNSYASISGYINSGLIFERLQSGIDRKKNPIKKWFLTRFKNSFRQYCTHTMLEALDAADLHDKREYDNYKLMIQNWQGDDFEDILGVLPYRVINKTRDLFDKPSDFLYVTAGPRYFDSMFGSLNKLFTKKAIEKRDTQIYSLTSELKQVKDKLRETKKSLDSNELALARFLSKEAQQSPKINTKD